MLGLLEYRSQSVCFGSTCKAGGARSFVVAKTYDLHITFRSISYFATPLIPSPCVITIYITGCLICESIWHCGRRRSQPTTPHTRVQHTRFDPSCLVLLLHLQLVPKNDVCIMRFLPCYPSRPVRHVLYK